MKRTATTLVLLAGFGGGCVSPDGATANRPAQPGGFGAVTRAREVPGVQGPAGEPVHMVAARGAMPQSGSPAPSQAAANQPRTTLFGGSGVQQASSKAGPGAGGVVQAHIPGGYAMKSGVVPASGFGTPGNGPSGPGAPINTGVLPVPGMGPPGAVAAVGALVPGMRPAVTNQRTSIRFTGPAGMKITWQLPGGGFNDEAAGLTAPKEYNFLQGQVYRLRLTQVLPNFPGRTFYPTLEVVPANPKTVTFLAHASVPVTFTDDDFNQVVSGNLVVKVIYLPDPAFQDFATVAGAEEIVSTRLEPGADPVAEAQRRGSILAIIRMGNIDLENRSSPGMTAPPGMVPLPPGAMMLPPGVVPPGALPPGVVPPGALPPGAVPPGTLPPTAGAPIPPKAPAPPAGPTPPIARPTPGPLPPTVSGTGTSTRPTSLPAFSK
jgi:hypothetical protein